MIHSSLKLSILALLAITPAVASAAAYLQVDVNSTTVQSNLVTGAPGFTGLLDTGTLNFQADATCDLDDVLFDGVSQTPTHVPVLVSGSINLVAGVVSTGSSISISFNTPTSTLSFSLLPGQGALGSETGGFNLIADMDTSTFTGGVTIGGVNITPWLVANDGGFFLHHYDPDGSGFANDVNLEVIVPEPASFSLLGLAGTLLAARRKR
ncbi:MAG TPA: PEP-CTERM sorting domain-containing protein [Tepidisphaeraceae bacterium]|nr:PEP-CTERM sorting domain-containing protein [Tepidisphaeraceae bacterium]